MLQKSGRLVLWEAMFILELHSAETQAIFIIHILCTLKLPHKHSPLFFRSDDRLKFWRMPEHPEMSVDNQR